MRSRGTLAVLALVALGAMLPGVGAARAQTKPDTIDQSVEPIDVAAIPLAGFDKSDPSRVTFGRLRWRGGLALSSTAESFGGWSGLALDADGQGFVAVSDAGVWMTGRIDYDGQKPKGMSLTRLGPIQALGGKVLRRNRDRDAEAVALVDGSTSRGELYIAFEQNQRIGRFDIAGKTLSPPRGYIEMPPELKAKRKGDGLEAIAVLAGGPFKGSVVAFAEHMRDADGRHSGWLWVKGKPQRFQLEDLGGFDITDVASQPDGGLVLLERRFRWYEGVKMRLRLIPAGDLAPGAVLKGETLYEAGMGHEIDNMEALAVHRGAQGEAVLTLLSDDNFNGFLQRTILLQFTLAPDAEARAR